MKIEPTNSSKDVLAALLRSKLTKSPELRDKQARLLQILKSSAVRQESGKGDPKC